MSICGSPHLANTGRRRSMATQWWESGCAMILDMLTTVPVSSVSLLGLPSPSWTHPWREWLPFPGWQGEDLAGLLEMPTSPRPVEPTEELWSCRTSSLSSGKCCGGPPLDWLEAQPSRTYQHCHKHYHAQKPVQITGCDDGVGHPMLMNRLNLEMHFRQGSHCELSSVKLHSQKLEVLAGC